MVWGGRACHGLYMEVRGQCVGVGFLLLPCCFGGLNSSHLAWWQAPSPTEPSQHASENIYVAWGIVWNLVQWVWLGTVFSADHRKMDSLRVTTWRETISFPKWANDLVRTRKISNRGGLLLIGNFASLEYLRNTVGSSWKQNYLPLPSTHPALHSR